MRQAAQARLLGSLLLLAASNAFGLGLGRVSTLSYLGNPLELSVGVSADLSDGLTAECVNAEVFVGDNRMANELVRIRINRAADGTPISLRLVTGARIDEPVATVNLMLGCPTSVTRRYVVFIDPPSLQLAQSEGGESSIAQESRTAAPLAPPRAPPARRRAPPVVVAAAPEATSREAGFTEAGTVSARAAEGERSRTVAAAPPRRRPVAPAASAALAETAAGARLQLESATAARSGAPAREQARGASAAGTGGPSIGELTAQVNANSLALDQERLRDLEQRFNRLRSDNEATKRSLAELEAGLKAARTDRFDRWVVYGLAAAVALLLLALALLLTRLLSRRGQASWSAGDSGPASEPPAISSPLQAAPAARRTGAAEDSGGDSRPDPAVEHSDAPWLAGPDVAADGAAQPASSVPQAGFEAEDSDEEDERRALDQPQTMPGPSYAVLGAAGAMARHNVSIDELIDLEQQAEFFTVLGQDEAAIELLTGHVQSTGDASPLPYLKLLEIYRRRGEQSAYTRTRERFNRRFGASVPDWEDEPRAGHSIEDHSTVADRLQSVWPDPGKAMDFLESLLFRRDPATPEFDLPVYGELLLLYSVARDLAERVVHDEVDLLLPLDDRSTAEEAPHSLNFDLSLDAEHESDAVLEGRSKPTLASLPEFNLNLLETPIVPPSIAASNEPGFGDADRLGGRSVS